MKNIQPTYEELLEKCRFLENKLAEKQKNNKPNYTPEPDIEDCLNNCIGHIQLPLLLFSSEGKLISMNLKAKDFFAQINHTNQPDYFFKQNFHNQIKTNFESKEIEVETIEGNKRILLFYVNTITENEQKIAWFFDITLYKQAEAHFRKHYSNLSVIINNFPFLAWLKDEKCRFLAVNDEFARSANYVSPDKILGLTDFDVWPNKYNKHYNADDLEVMRTKTKKIVQEKVIIHGHERYFETYKSPLFNEQGEVTGTTGFAIDITERKIMEQRQIEILEELKKNEQLLLQQNQLYESLNEELQQTNLELFSAKEKAEESDMLKSTFLANMSHEIRTPLNAVLGFAGLMEGNSNKPDKIIRYANIIKLRGNDLLCLINDILDISKIQANQLNINEVPEDINKLLDEVYTFFSTQEEIFSKKDSLVLQVVNYLPYPLNHANFDYQRVKQILINLVNNAIKFTNKGFVKFGCTISENKLQFIVADTGIGIAPEKQQLIFEPFRQIENNNLVKTVSGTGLGLAISKGLCQLMGGSIEVKSIDQQGSEFTFFIPFKPIEQLTEGVDISQLETYNWSSKMALIVEDDEFSLEYLKEILAEVKIQYKIASSKKAAMQLIMENACFDIVLMDIRLPDGNGYELTKWIKQLFPKLPVIAQTANAMENDRQKSLLAGCDEYVSKPLLKESLYFVMNKLFTR